jgi:hypothetical protein
MSAKTSTRRSTAIRRILFTVSISAACYVAYVVGGRFSEWRHVAPTTTAPTAITSNFNAMAAVLPLAGRWSFAELDWDFRSAEIPQKDVAARLDKLGSSPATQSTEQLPDVSPELLELAEKLRIKPVERNGNLIYSLNQPFLKVRLIARATSGRYKAAALAVAYPEAGDRWTVMEFTPRGAAASSTSTTGYLLPLPAGSKRSGGRFADDGSALLELITLNTTAKDVFATWKDAGWEVRHTGLGQPGDFSYLCVRGDQVIYAWSADPGDALQNLMLVQTPASSDEDL